MSENNLIECTYAHHITNIDEFAASGLRGPYKICRKCSTEKIRKYRQKHNKEYNDKVREYKRQYMANKRAEEKKKIDVITKGVNDLISRHIEA